MFSYKLSEIADAMNAKLVGKPDQIIESIWIDSRHIVLAKNGIFFALKGAQIDGHSYIQSAYEKGIRNFVLSKIPENIEDANFLVVDNPKKALQDWAKYHRQKFDYRVVGITGSNGKTIVKEWLYQLLYDKIKLIRSPKSFNSQIGVPISVLEMMEGISLAIFELGISQPNEMQHISDIVKPNIAIITNIGQAHSEFFENREQHILEKIQIAEHAEIIIYPSDDTALRQAIKHKYPNKKHISWGESREADIQKVESKEGLKVIFKDKTYQLPFEYKDEASRSNALICFAALTQLDIDLESILDNFKRLMPVEMRLEVLEGSHQIEIINDAFNSDLSSIPIALNVLNHHAKQKKTLILTDILQNRQKGAALYQEVADWVNAYPIQKVVLIGEEIIEFKALFKNLYASFTDTSSFLNVLKASDFAGETILLKGARKFELERISKVLEKKSHDTILEVNLQNLLENLNYFRSKLEPSTKLMAMVKAFGYGAGGFDISQALASQNIDYLGVAYADEGAELRQQGISTPIIVMNPEQNSYTSIIESSLEPEIYSLRVLRKFTEKLIDKNIATAYPIHIKLNTGMNRLGFKLEDISELIQELADNPYVKVKTIFSHLATSDVPSEHAFVHQQMQKYREMYERIVTNIGYRPTRHILNSAGILNFPDYQMDMVRVGIGMFGVSMGSEHQKHLKTVVTFKTVISQISTLQAGDTVSYGRNFKANEITKIATLPVGYADGLKRSLGNENGHVSIHGQLAPIIGTVCMDMMMVDISGINCQEGDEVIIFGEKPSLEEVAEQCNTITYEILTSISSRVKRIYLKE